MVNDFSDRLQNSFSEGYVFPCGCQIVQHGKGNSLQKSRG